MKRLLLWLAALSAAYQGGAVLGYRIGVVNGRRITDHEWARMLENGMVGPGTTAHPVRG